MARILAQILSRQYAPLKLRTRSESTRRLYGTALANFARFIGRHPTLRDLTDAKLSDFADWHIERGRSPATANRDLCSLLALWRWAAQRGMVKRWPEIEMLLEPEDEPQAWLRHELRALFDAIARVPGWIAGIRAREWWRALHLVLFDTGERIGAVLLARWCDVDLRGKWITFRAVTRKGGRRGKVLPLHPETIAALREIRDPPRSLVFPWDRNREYLWKRYATDILIPAGLPDDRRSKFHKMRRSVASYCEAEGMDATRLLGHSDRRVTERYLDARIVHPQGPATVLFRPDKAG